MTTQEPGAWEASTLPGRGPCPGARTIRLWDRDKLVRCGSRSCRVCGSLWEGDQRIRAVAAAEHLRGDVALITVTAPGRDYFTGGLITGLDCHDHEKWWWNRTARRRWAGLHREASGAARASARRLGCDWRVLYRSWEYQKRGLLHVHLVLPFGTPEERETTGRYVADLARAAGWWGYGYVLGGARRDAPRRDRAPRVAAASSKRAASYVAKYLSSMGTGKDGMATVAKRTAKRGSVLYVSPKLTRASGVTMRTLRGRRAVCARYPWARTSRAAWVAACAAHGTMSGRPPMHPKDEERLVTSLLTSRGWGVWNSRTKEVIRPTPAALPPELAAEHGPAPPVRGVVEVSLASVRHRVHTPAAWGLPTTRITSLTVRSLTPASDVPQST